MPSNKPAYTITVECHYPNDPGEPVTPSDSIRLTSYDASAFGVAHVLSQIFGHHRDEQNNCAGAWLGGDDLAMVAAYFATRAVRAEVEDAGWWGKPSEDEEESRADLIREGGEAAEVFRLAAMEYIKQAKTIARKLRGQDT